MASTNTKNEESSIARAPQQITPACFKIAGIATLPTAEVPVKNLVALTQLYHQSSGGKILTNTHYENRKQQNLTMEATKMLESNLLSDSVKREELSELAKNSNGMGRSTYIITVSIGHQLS
uniref:Vacuolar protein sorting-associated protein 55 homolog n=1 Tax=Rhizophora mucronata TaxID=61149 RepID=A0A2P2JUP4_RHIMU